ncbi:MAG: phosphopentomutase, partial [Rhodothermales bacterium]
MQEASAGKDSTTGHWELAGIRTDKAFPTYPDGFPEDVIARFIAATGARGVLGNKAASGTAIIDELGAEHQRTGLPI